MSSAVSADGKTVVVDILGRLYAVPIFGGVARTLTDPGEAWDFCPRFSPDGEHLAFLSDRGGRTDIWIMDWDTRDVRQVSDAAQVPGRGDLSRYSFSCAPTWTLDGQMLVGRDNVMLRPTGQMRFIPVVGNRSHQVVTVERVSDAASSAPASIVLLADEKRAIADVAFTLPAAASAKPRRRDLFWLDLESGELSLLREKGAEGSAYGPQLSPSGRLLAYLLRRSPDDIELRLRDLATGTDRGLSALIGAEDFAQRILLEMPGYAFTPDERYVVVAYGGKIHRISTGTGANIAIPFEATISREVPGRIVADQPLEDGPVTVRTQRWPTLSGERDLLLFTAAGSVWIRALPNGTPRRLGTGETLDSMAALSPDATRVAYVSYEHSQNAILSPGRLMLYTVAEMRAVPVIDDGASYYWPTWSPDQSKLAVVRRAGDGGQRNGQEGDGQGAWAELGWIDIEGKTFHPVASVNHYLAEDLRGSRPRWISWSGDGERLFFQGFKGWSGGTRPYREPLTLEEVRLDGSERRVIAQGGLDVHAMIPSPDLAHIAVIGWDQNAYLIALNDDADAPVRISLDTPGAKRISSGGALYLRWTDSRRLIYGWMDRVFEYRIGQDAARAEEISQTTLNLERRHGRGVLAFRNARLITMSGEEGTGPVIERGTIVIRDRRIVALGGVDTVAVPEHARVVDASGMTIMPGLVDTHYHGVDPDTLSFYVPGVIDGGDRALAYGITTAFEPGGGSIDDSSEDWRTLLETGQLRGPRWFFDSIKGMYLRPDDADETLADIRARLKRKRDLGQGPCLKELADHNGGHARLVAKAAREAGVCLVAHVEHHPIHSISRVANGAALHHNSILPPLYDDVVQFLAQAEMSWTPHIALEWNMDMPQETQPRDNLPVLLKRLDTIMDASGRARFARYYETHERYGPMIDNYRDAPLDLFERSGRPALLAAADKLLDTEVHMSLSGHDRLGPLRGEMLDWQEGGISPGRILRAATLGGAEQLGLDSDLGSLEGGKIADFLVLKANPLDDVVNTIRLKWTVIDGVVYESDTLRVVTE